VIKRGLEVTRRHPTPVTGGIMLALVIALVVALNWAGGPSASPPSASSRPITTMHFFNADVGWVLSLGTLLMTRDGGRHWRDITPGRPEPAIELTAVQFLDPIRGWTIGGYGAHSVQVFRTTDGGATWKSSQLAVDAPLDAGLDFIDPQHGWLMIATPTTNVFTSAGQLFQTADGGVTWTALPAPPSGHPVRFINLSTGWTVGGASFDQLYLTRDGGQSWQQLRVTVPTAYNETASAFDLPAFIDSRLGILRVMFADGSVQLNFSSDVGQTWRSDPTRAPIFVRQPPYARYQQTVAPTFVGNGVIAVVLGTELKVQSSSGWLSLKPRGFDSVVQIEFVNSRVGWAVSSHFNCAGSGADQRCNSLQDLLRSVDGGRSWNAVPVSKTG
jgi:photosystem II stability/assembly factor-like uncharacterized protein